jgi:phage terminase small subunit
MSRPKNPTTQATPGIPLKPSGLSAQASKEWDRLLKELTDAGIQITVAHRAAISLAATIAADIKSDWAQIQEKGAYTFSPTRGTVAHPAVKRMDALRRDYLKALSMIGLRPGLSEDKTEGQTLSDALNG